MRARRDSHGRHPLPAWLHCPRNSLPRPARAPSGIAVSPGAVVRVFRLHGGLALRHRGWLRPRLRAGLSLLPLFGHEPVFGLRLRLHGAPALPLRVGSSLRLRAWLGPRRRGTLALRPVFGLRLHGGAPALLLRDAPALLLRDAPALLLRDAPALLLRDASALPLRVGPG